VGNGDSQIFSLLNAPIFNRKIHGGQSRWDNMENQALETKQVGVVLKKKSIIN
jgi:hypothetical protein